MAEALDDPRRGFRLGNHRSILHIDLPADLCNFGILAAINGRSATTGRSRDLAISPVSSVHG